MHIPQVIADLFASRPVTIAQFAPNVFARLGEKRQYRLIALLALILGSSEKIVGSLRLRQLAK